MASSYEILASESATELVGDQLKDVLEISARSLPSGVVFKVRFPPVINDPETIATVLSAWGDEYNDIAAQPGVVGVRFLQDFDASDQVQDKLVVTIDSTSGAMQITRTDIPFEWYPAKMKAAIAETRAQLDAIEGA